VAQRSGLGFVPYLVPYATFLGLVTLGAPLALRVALPGVLFVYFLVRGGYPELRGARGLGACVSPRDGARRLGARRPRR